jgi:hypothetical protein
MKADAYGGEYAARSHFAAVAGCHIHSSPARPDTVVNRTVLQWFSADRAFFTHSFPRPNYNILNFPRPVFSAGFFHDRIYTRLSYECHRAPAAPYRACQGASFRGIGAVSEVSEVSDFPSPLNLARAGA